MDFNISLPERLKDILDASTAFLLEKGIDAPRLDSELFLAHALGVERTALFANLYRPLTKDEFDAFQCLVRRRAAREPVAYILGKKEFWSLEFKVDRRALIPRPETELLVSCVLERAGLGASMGLDIGTGSGVLPVVLTKELKALKIVAVDSSGDALALARENAKIHGVEDRIEFLKGDLFSPLEGRMEGQFDFIVSNPPYIPMREIQALTPEIKKYEPAQALDGGEDGLEVIRKIVRLAPRYLKGGRFLFLEMGAGQGEGAKEIFTLGGEFEEPEIVKDYAGLDRVIFAKKKQTF